jgi:hypothetical protein
VKRRGYITFACLLSIASAGLALPAGAAKSINPSISASALLAKSEQATEAAGGVRVTGSETFSNGTKWNSVLDSSLHDSHQTGQGSGGRELVDVIGSDVYIDGNETYYLTATGLDKPKLANRWVLVTSTSALYHDNQSGELLTSLAKSVFQLNSPQNDGVVTYDGHRVIKVSGKLPSSSGAPNSPQTVYISTTAPYLPVAYVLRVSSDDESIAITSTFSKWGESVKVVAPSQYVTAS